MLATISVQCLDFYLRVCGLVKSNKVFGRGRNVMILLISVSCSRILGRIYVDNSLPCFYSAGN